MRDAHQLYRKIALAARADPAEVDTREPNAPRVAATLVSETYRVIEVFVSLLECF